MEQLQLSGHGEQQQALVRLQRPGMGLGPAAVVEGFTFQHSSSLQALQEAGPAAASEAAAEGCVAAGDGACGDAVAAAAAAAAAASSEVGTALDAASSSGWFDYLLLSSGDFSVVEHANMFPNSLSHCGQGRALHNARSAADVASFVAEPCEPALRQHMINLIRQAWDRRNYEEGSNATDQQQQQQHSSRSRDSRGLDPRWVFGKIQQRWGAAAMEKFGVDDGYFSARFMESGVMTLPAPTVTAAVPDVGTYISADG
ncbi:hypothetical protein COO60DRAFT_1635681 [Scenedesmus sp. NREL 46B-D3]|nr:hypothetical protein COO60DRAFT_1635681 [Scenedesmus sp. NREL 46B-D3]